MDRREFLASSIGAAGILALGNPLGKFSKKSKRPNIIFFFTDDQDMDSNSAFGGNVITPNIQRLADEGMMFTNAHMSSTVCTPSRYTCLTGRYAGRSYFAPYMEDNPIGTQGFPSFGVGVEEDGLNVGAAMKQSGYVTGYVGKWHVGEDIKRKDEFKAHGLEWIPLDADPKDPKTIAAARSNHEWYKQQIRGKGFDYAEAIYWENMKAPHAEHNPEWTINAALDFIEDNKDKPFYLHYCTTLMHGGKTQWTKSMKYPHISGEGYLDVLPDVMPPRQTTIDRVNEKGLEEYTAGYTWLDDSIGAVLDKLDELGIADNTIFVYVPDHGSFYKSSLFAKNGTQVPLIIRWPEKIKAGSESDELVQNIDFVPTWYDVAGAKLPKNYKLDGRSLLPLLAGDDAEWRDSLYFEIGYGRAVQTKDYKYIAVRYPKEQMEQIKNSTIENLPKNLAYIGRLGIGTRGALNPNFFDSDQLYYLPDDPDEQNNLAGDPKYQFRLEKMKTILRKYLQSFKGRPFGEFVPGGNAAAARGIQKQIEMVKKLTINNKEVIVPDELKQTTTKTKRNRKK
jgi:arylsulfatase A-like enzyme